MDFTLALTGLNTTEAVALIPALTNTFLVFFQDSFADENEVTVTDVEITVDNVRYLSDSRNLIDEDKVDMNVQLYLEKSNAITVAAMESIVKTTVQSFAYDYLTEIQSSVSSDITGGDIIFFSDSTSTTPSIKPTSLPTQTPSAGPTDAPSVSKRPSTTPSDSPSAGKSVVTAQTLAAVAGGAAAAASSVRFIHIYICLTC
jgi:hypothetical protein